MAPTAPATPGIGTFLKSLKHTDVESAIENLISLLKRRQIRSARSCAIATAQLLLRVVAASKVREAAPLIARVRSVGQRLIAAQPREMAVGNIVRRVLGLIREVVEDGADADNVTISDIGHTHSSSEHTPTRPPMHTHISHMSPLKHGPSFPSELSIRPKPSLSVSSSMDNFAFEDIQKRPSIAAGFGSYASASPQVTLFGLLSHPDEASPSQTPPPGTQSPVPASVTTQAEPKVDVKAEVIDGIKELLDELDVVDDQIAASALEHIHSNEIILTHTSSQTVQKFLLAAARKRKFTVVHAEAYPNDHLETHSTIMHGRKKGMAHDQSGDDRWKPLTALGITVILIPDSAVFAIMSRVNKVLLAPHTVLANGGLIAAAGASTITQAAKVHQTPVMVVGGVYKLSPVYPFDTDELIEYGDPSKVVGFEEGDLVQDVEVVNPLFDYVPADLVDLYITNLGGHAPSYLYRIVADHYRTEDIDLSW